MALRAAVSALAVAVGAASLLATASAWAQQPTFHLDRLEMPGAPDDGMVLFRPVTQQNTIIYGQLGLGYSLNPLRMSDILPNSAVGGSTLRASDANAITNQFTSYASFGMEFFDHLTVGLTFPVTWVQTGNEQQSGNNGGIVTGATLTAYDTNGPALDDLRLDFRYVVLRNEDRSAAL